MAQVEATFSARFLVVNGLVAVLDSAEFPADIQPLSAVSGHILEANFALRSERLP